MQTRYKICHLLGHSLEQCFAESSWVLDNAAEIHDDKDTDDNPMQEMFTDMRISP